MQIKNVGTGLKPKNRTIIIKMSRQNGAITEAAHNTDDKKDFHQYPSGGIGLDF